MAVPATHPIRDRRGALPPDPRELLRVRVGDLVVDRNAQRETNPDRVDQIANDFRWELVEAPTCVRLLDGRFRVVEAQHRVLAMQRRDPETLVWVFVLPDGLEIGEESGLALAITSSRRAHTLLQKWELLVRKGEPHEVQADEVLRMHGLRLGAAPSPTSIKCVGEIRRLIHHGQFTPEVGAEMLDRLLDVIEEAYPPDSIDSASARWNRDLVRAVGVLVIRNPHMNQHRISKVLRDRVAQQWIAHGSAVAEQPAHQLIAEALVTRYNKALRSAKARISL